MVPQHLSHLQLLHLVSADWSRWTCCTALASTCYTLPPVAWFKSWTFWSNFPAVESLACMCQHPRGFHPSFAGKRLPDGSFATRHTACYPWQAIVRCVQPWLSLRSATIHFAAWRHLLPTRLSGLSYVTASRTVLALAALHSGRFPANVIPSRIFARPGSAASCNLASFRLSCHV